MRIRPFEPADEDAVIALWGRCGLLRPWNDPRTDIRRKMQVRPDLFLVGGTYYAVFACVLVPFFVSVRSITERLSLLRE